MDARRVDFDRTDIGLYRHSPAAPFKHTVTELRVLEGKLAIEVQGWDKLWCMKSRLEFPLEHVIGVRPADDPVGGLRTLGTHIPGVITAGTFLQEGNRVFWNVRDPAKAIAVDLREERYSKLVVEVADPAETIRALHHAIARELPWIRLAG